MLDASKLKKHSIKSKDVTFLTNKAASTGKLINPYEPFKGKDGKNYLIGYDKRLNNSTNCYAFAMGWTLAAKNRYDDYVPGFMTGHPYSVALSEKLVRGDLEAVGRKVYEVIYQIPKELPEGEGYWIKFMYCPERGDLDAHFMRKDKKSGRWIHKMGWEMPPKLCVRKVEFGSKKDAILDMMRADDVPMDFVESMLTTIIPKEMYAGSEITKSEIETDDASGYLAFDERERLIQYKALWAMRISEP